jgi:NAD(P)-dependent dehydrogenase (short-subunit alcohol dehydrogenase family)
MDDMNDVTALVTGANQGIGQEIARQLAGAVATPSRPSGAPRPSTLGLSLSFGA